MRVDGFLLGLILATVFFTPQAFAEDPPPESSAVAEETREEKTEEPSMELLEFLAEWETTEGERLDPEEIKQMPALDDAPKEDTSNDR